jgi:hypothetical protein
MPDPAARVARGRLFFLFFPFPFVVLRGLWMVSSSRTAVVAALGIKRAVEAGLGRDVLRFTDGCAGAVVADAAHVGVSVVAMLTAVAMRWDVVFLEPLVGQELVDEAFCSAVAWWWPGRLGPDKGALAAVGIRYVKEYLFFNLVGGFSP